jgi:hypothetical protein
VCQRLPLTSFLILPFQRVTRLKMLVEVAHFRQGREGEAGLQSMVCGLSSMCFVVMSSFFLLVYTDYA